MHMYQLIKMYNIIMCNLLNVTCTSIKLLKYICNKRMMCLYVRAIKREVCTVGASLSEQPLRHRDVIMSDQLISGSLLNILSGTLGEVEVCVRHELTCLAVGPIWKKLNWSDGDLYLGCLRCVEWKLLNSFHFFIASVLA